MKPGVFSQLYEQLVFAVRFRESLLSKPIRELLFPYISGIVSNLGHKSFIVNGYFDHVHVFYGRNPSVSTSDTVAAIKKSSAWFVNENRWFHGRFQWQDGYGAFSYGNGQIDNIYKYILFQEEHHSGKKFKHEYVEMLTEAGIVYDEKYLFDFFDVSDPDIFI